MKITEILQIIEKLETFRFDNVYTLEQIEKDKRTLADLREQLRLCGVGVTYCECKKPTLGGSVWDCGCGKPHKKKGK